MSDSSHVLLLFTLLDIVRLADFLYPPLLQSSSLLARLVLRNQPNSPLRIVTRFDTGKSSVCDENCIGVHSSRRHWQLGTKALTGR